VSARRRRLCRCDLFLMPLHSYDVLLRLPARVPAGMVERAVLWTPDSVPRPPAPAASVILLRDA
jgi:hypothetical protein